MDKDPCEESERDYSVLRIPVAVAVFFLWSLLLIEGRRFVENLSPLYLTLAGVIFVALLSRLKSSAFKESPYILPSVLMAAWVVEEFMVGRGAHLSSLVLMSAGCILFVCLFSIIMELDSPPEAPPLRGGDAHFSCLLTMLLALTGSFALPASLTVLRSAILSPDFSTGFTLVCLAVISLGVSFTVTRKHKVLRVAAGFWSSFVLVYLTTLLLFSHFPG